ncbi:MAG: DUF2851 family protein [Dehalococcoidia bacterium]|nr:DUF2851 family protein [Dehalococcoidia bacterium]
MPLLLRERRAQYQGADEPEEAREGAENAGAGALLIEFPAAAEPHLREDELVRLWEGQRFPREALRTRQGEALQVVHRGRRNLGAGPDFLDAIIADGRGRLIKGDVELHVRASAFVAHGHHLDPRYDNVVLHVVFHDDAGEPTLLRCGRRAAVVALAPWVARRAEQLRLWLAQPSSWTEPCRSAIACSGWPEVGEMLSRLGQMRFRHKQARFAGALRRQGANQALYEGILRTLGYSRNQETFARLAHLLPYERLRQALDHEGLIAAEALLLGSGGLLPGQLGQTAAPPYVLALERRWARVPSRQVPPEVWQLSGLRPENHPARRLAGLARLLGRWPSLVAGLRSLEEADSASLSRLLAAWQVPADGFWQSHHDLDGRGRPPFGSLIGRGRALEVLVNAVLPFAAAFGETRGLDALSRRALGLFLRLPSAGSYGGTRFLESVLRPSGGDNLQGACRQQGRLYLYNHYCAAGECTICPLSGRDPV